MLIVKRSAFSIQHSAFSGKACGFAVFRDFIEVKACLELVKYRAARLGRGRVEQVKGERKKRRNWEIGVDCYIANSIIGLKVEGTFAGAPRKI